MAFEKDNDQVQTNKAAAGESNERRRGDRQSRDSRRVARHWTAGAAEQGRAAQFCKMVREEAERTGNLSAVVKEPDSELARDLSSSHGFVVYADRIGPDLFWHLVVFESELKPVRAEQKKDRRNRRHDRDDDKTYEFFTTTDSIDNDLVSTIEGWVKENIAVDGEYIFTNATVIPAELDLEQANVCNLIAFDAEDSNILLSDTDEPFTAELLRKNSQLRCKLDFVPTTDKLDMTGLPLRSDFQMAVEEKFRENTNNILLAKNGTRSIVSLNGFVNPRWVGHLRAAEYVRNQDDIDPACYVPEVVATEINPYHPDVMGGNFERFFLAVSTMPYLKDGDSWMKQFESSVHGKTSKVSGLAYGMEWPEGLPNDLELVDEDPNETERWVGKVFHVNDKGRIPVDFALMIKEGGIGYTTAKLLLDVADKERSAIDKVVQVMDNLTNGVFSEEYPVRNERDIVAGQVRVPTGYYKTAEGIRPIEDLDTLYILNQLKDNYPEMLDDYIECTQIEDRRFDADVAMTKMIEILQHVVGGEFVLKGFATKLYFEPEFLMAAAKAVQDSDAGLNMELDTTVDVGLRRSRRRGYTGSSFGLTESPYSRSRRSYSGSGRRGGYHTRYNR